VPRLTVHLFVFWFGTCIYVVMLFFALDVVAKLYFFFLLLLLSGEIALVQATSPIATHFSVAWSVRRLSHSCTMLKPFDGFRCHLAGTLVGSSDTLC